MKPWRKYIFNLEKISTIIMIDIIMKVINILKIHIITEIAKPAEIVKISK
jgi:hypothetical protein